MICLAISTASFASGSFPSEIPSAAEYALTWSLPDNQCEPPAAFRGLTLINEEGVEDTLRKLNPGQKRLADKKKKKYDSCIVDYKTHLIAELETLKNSARHGLTQDQAKTILTKMAFIQQVIESPMALPPELTSE